MSLKNGILIHNAANTSKQENKNYLIFVKPEPEKLSIVIAETFNGKNSVQYIVVTPVPVAARSKA
jgi:hypothetical protein